MTFRKTLVCGVAAAALTAGGARAATINLIDDGSVAGTQAALGFQIAADYWGHMLTNNVTINIGIGFHALPKNVIGSTGSTQQDLTVKSWENAVNATKSNSSLDQNIVLPTLNNKGGVTFIANGVDATGNNNVSAADQFLDQGTTVDSKVLFENTAVVKAIGLNPTYAASNTQHLDANMTFSSTFAFDFNPTDGIKANTFDFVGVAIHEMGHALGFVSGEDLIDYFAGPNGPGSGPPNGPLGYDLNDTSIFSALDMFRYSNDPNNLAPGNKPVLDLTVGTNSYFSVNGGTTALYGNTFATGAFNGDGDQTSHWKDATGANACGPQLGIMDPTFCFGQMGDVTSLDVAAFDAMGWNLSVDALAGTYNQNTGQIAVGFGVPEPSTWVLSIAGFGMMGAALRRRRATAATA